MTFSSDRVIGLKKRGMFWIEKILLGISSGEKGIKIGKPWLKITNIYCY